MRCREYNEDPPLYVFNEGEFTNDFTVEVVYNGYFCGTAEKLEYVSASSACFDYCSQRRTQKLFQAWARQRRVTTQKIFYGELGVISTGERRRSPGTGPGWRDGGSAYDCSTDTWSLQWIDEILRILGEKRDERLHVYWLLPGKEIQNGLVLVDKYAHISAMIKASRVHKTLVLFVDSTNFLQIIRPKLLVTLPGLPSIISQKQIPAPSTRNLAAEASSSSVVTVPEKEIDQHSSREAGEAVLERVQSDDSSSDSDFELYDSDFDVEDGDDDLFSANVDRAVNDNNEQEVCDEHEDEAALDDDDLHLQEGDKLQLQKHFKSFNPEVDMDNPTFRLGMVFSGVEEDIAGISS